jgi:hypothetical protein
MAARRITQITLDVLETFTIRPGAGSVQAHCSRCGTLATLITPAEAAVILGFGLELIFKEVESGRIHVQQSGAKGTDLICLRSLREAAPRLLSVSSQLQIHPTKENPS